MKSIFAVVLCAAAVARAQAPEPVTEVADAGIADTGLPGSPPDHLAITVTEPVIEPTPWWRHFHPFGYAKV
ncbi:MAG: hypothetical protein H6Q89_916, partial [Myxococcaceae bacterium]|nr:hypothetical protein [Myxococcaceae bacterium]